ncbi:hypothetical protein OESDEN_23800 [Oesophagostomum dentatum]|uniref:Uncharacterized protein n=1 Tax=Oesophagostomum dentatum TaxID=61180 RepID=A0A0B1S052_OESDE|nr:hypothetical protein OESDEN_23800 [Oesophagostomum dentatum]
MTTKHPAAAVDLDGSMDHMPSYVISHLAADLKTNVSEDERLRHVSYFVQVLKSTVFSTEINDLLSGCDLYDDDFKIQVLETKTHLHKQIEQLIQVVDELGNDLRKRRMQAEDRLKSAVTSSRSSRGLWSAPLLKLFVVVLHACPSESF